MFRVVFEPPALGEAAGALAWYGHRSPRAAAGLLAELERGLGRLAEAPRACPLHVHGTRRLILHRYPFQIVFLLRGDIVHVVAVAHLSRKPGYWAAPGGT